MKLTSHFRHAGWQALSRPGAGGHRSLQLILQPFGGRPLALAGPSRRMSMALAARTPSLPASSKPDRADGRIPLAVRPLHLVLFKQRSTLMGAKRTPFGKKVLTNPESGI